MQTWVNPDTGVANNFLDSLTSISDNPEVVMLLILAVFAGSHSGLAYLRPYGELSDRSVIASRLRSIAYVTVLVHGFRVAFDDQRHYNCLQARI